MRALAKPRVALAMSAVALATAANATATRAPAADPAQNAEHVIRRKKGKRYYDPSSQPRASHGGAIRRQVRAERARLAREQRTPATEADVQRVAKAESKRARKASRRLEESTHGR